MTNGLRVSAPVDVAIAAPPAPLIDSVVNAPAPQGQTVAIEGVHFGAMQGDGYVYLSDGGINWGAPQDVYKLKIDSWSSRRIVFTLPVGSGPDATAPLAPGTVAALSVVTGGGAASNVVNLAVQ